MIEHLSFIELEKFKFLRLYLAILAALFGCKLVPLIGFLVVMLGSASLFEALGNQFLCFHKTVACGMLQSFEALFLVLLHIAAVAVELGEFHLCLHIAKCGGAGV